MALPPTVPTSFVPRPQTASVRRRSNFTGAFAFLGYGVLSVIIALSIGAFIYSQILTTEQANKDRELQKQIAAIDPSTVTKFVRLRDRLSYSLTLLNKHVALSGFWHDLVSIAPATVRFKTMHISQDATGLIKLEATGAAKSFNALAATSDAFAKDGRIKDAVFSAIQVQGTTVSFSLEATVDPSLVAFTPEAPATAPPSGGSGAAPSSSSSTPQSIP